MPSSKNDLTIIFLTINRVPEQWAAYHKEILLEAAGDHPIITVSRKPTAIGTNLIDEERMSSSNIYWQLLRAAKLAKTPFIGQAEDDTLYTKEHFNAHRPAMDTFAYNLSRWSLYTWGKPTYSWRKSPVGASLIAPREKFIQVLEERFKKFNGFIPTEFCSELGFREWEQAHGFKKEKYAEFYTCDPIIQVNHDFFSFQNTGTDAVAKRHKKRMGFMRATDIPVWGKAEDLIKNFK
jgi:hypothetical protein